MECVQMSNLKTIYYYPELREEVGSINAVIVMGYLENCFSERGQVFYKFMEPCNHKDYVKGESCVEELGMTAAEFRTAFKYIGVVYKSKKAFQLSKDKFQGKMYLSYYDRMNKLTYYMRNDEKMNGIRKEMDEAEEIIKVQETNKEEQAIETTGDEVPVNRNTECLNVVNEESGDDINNKFTYNESNKSLSLNNHFNTNYKDYESIDLSLNTNNNTNLIDSSLNVNNDINFTEVKEACEVPFDAIKKLFNQICKSFEEIVEWTSWQKQKLEYIWVKYERDLETFRIAFEQLESSDFLCGRKKSWKAYLGWILKPHHFADILMGKYRNYKKTVSEAKGAYVDIESHDWDFDEIERLERQYIERILKERGYAL